jgi:hypothetical protein
LSLCAQMRTVEGNLQREYFTHIIWDNFYSPQVA